MTSYHRLTELSSSKGKAIQRPNTNKWDEIANEIRKISLNNSEFLSEGNFFDFNFSTSSILCNLQQGNDCSCGDETCENCTSTNLRAPLRMNTAAKSLSSESTSSSLSSQARSLGGLSVENICGIHSNNFTVYCQTCNVPICEDCDIVNLYHVTHITYTINESLDITNGESNDVLSEISTGLRDIDKDLHSINVAFASLEAKAKEAVDDLNKSWFLVKIALEERRRKLLTEIEHAKNYRWDILKERETNLKNCQRKLIDLIKLQHTAIEATALEKNPFHLRIANGKAIGVTFEVNEIRKMVVQFSDTWIGFSVLKNPLLEAISVFGSVLLSNPGDTEDRRVIRRRVPPTTINQNICNTPVKMLPFLQNPRGRPIASIEHSVVLWTEKPRSSNFYTPSIKIIGKNIQNAEDPDNLCRPWGVACDKEGNIFVADRSNNRILVFREDGTLIRRIGGYGTGPEQFNRPAGLTIDERRRIIVVDKDNHRIQILTIIGTFLLEFGKRGSENGQFNYPWDVAANSACEIVVSDTRNHRIQLFSSEGIFLRKFGTDTMGSFKVLDSPRGVAFTPEGNVILTDFNSHRVLCVDYKFISIRVLNCDGAVQAMSHFQRPQGVIVDDDGNIIVSNSRGYKITIFNKFGVFLKEFGKQGEGIDEMDRPSGVALLPNGKIVFVDFGNNRVVIR